MKILEFRTDRHRYFDNLLDFLIANACQMMAMVQYNESGLGKYEPGNNIVLEGLAVPSSLYFYPYEVLVSESRGIRPTSFYLRDEPGGFKSHQSFQKAAGRTFAMSQAQAMFTGYYEKGARLLEKDPQYGHDHWTRWPQVWNFGRVVRNSLSHDFQVEIRGVNKGRAVRWKEVTITPSHNGTLIFDFLSTADLIYLMMAMDTAL